MKKSGASPGQPASELISKRIAELGDWRGETLGRMRKLVKQAVPDVVEEWKWMGTPVWSRYGIICTGESYKKVVKLTFAKGASLRDPARLFNSSLDGNARRAIDIHEDFSAKSVRILQSRVGHRCSNPECRRPLMPRFGKRGAAGLGFDAVADLAPFTTPIHVSAQGMLTWKLVPPPTVLSTQMRPLWASTIPLQIASPSPALARDA